MNRKKTKLVRGVGINDADYPVSQTFETIGCVDVDGKQKYKRVWRCPFYVKWISMIERCYSENIQTKYPTYKDCFVTDKWLTFSNFKAWMEQQDWKDKNLDKDILFPGNKIYSPETCVFVEARVNKFVLENTGLRGEWPIGVIFNKRAFQAMCKSVTTGRQEYLGRFKTSEEAYQAWLAFKLEQAYVLAAEQTDERVAKALIDRYENFGDYQKVA